MTRRTLVIGGTRNLGPDLVAALVARGDAVTVLNRGLTPGALPPEVARLTADRSDPVALATALGSRDFDCLVDTTLYAAADASVLAELLRGRVGRVVFWSTGQVYLVREGPRPPYREEDYDGPAMAPPPEERPGDLRNWDYGVQKRGAEDGLRAAATAGAFELVVLRMPMIHSTRDHYGRIAGYVHRMLDGGPILVPAEGGPPLRHVAGADVVTATLRAAEVPLAAPLAVNIGQDDTLELDDMLARLARLVGRGPWIVRVPRRELDARGLLPACSPFSDAWMSALDNARARERLGIRFARVDDYLPPLVAAARARPAAGVPGYGRRAEELLLAAHHG